jgi:peptide/nickel transport system permease protein
MSLPAVMPSAAAPKPIRFETVRLLLRSPAFLIGLVIVLFWIGCATFGQSLVDPLADDILNTLAPPSADHWFGTDELGRDMFARVIAGSRDILVVAPLATLLGVVLGTTLGLIMGYFPGLVDDLLSRVIEAVLALPLLIVALIALTALGVSNATVILSIGLSFTPHIARTVRAAVLSERDLDYVAAARLRGENALYIMGIEILPNVLPPILVELTVRLGYAIFTVATLSFLGVGLQPPSSDWGLAISENYALIGGGYWWTVLFDALAIASLVIAINLVADGLQGAAE